MQPHNVASISIVVIMKCIRYPTKVPHKGTREFQCERNRGAAVARGSDYGHLRVSAAYQGCADGKRGKRESTYHAARGEPFWAQPSAPDPASTPHISIAASLLPCSALRMRVFGVNDAVFTSYSYRFIRSKHARGIRIRPLISSILSALASTRLHR